MAVGNHILNGWFSDFPHDIFVKLSSVFRAELIKLTRYVGQGPINENEMYLETLRGLYEKRGRRDIDSGPQRVIVQTHVHTRDLLGLPTVPFPLARVGKLRSDFPRLINGDAQLESV